MIEKDLNELRNELQDLKNRINESKVRTYMEDDVALGWAVELVDKLIDNNVALPFIAMIQQQLDDNGNFDRARTEQSKNGRYAVVYLDKKQWKIPLIDICSRKLYGKEFAEKRLKQLKEQL